MRRKLLLGLCLVVLFLVLVITNDGTAFIPKMPFLDYSDSDITCYDRPSLADGSSRLPLFDDQEAAKKRGRNIFFHETSCFGDDGITFNSRQACAVESAARMNPTETPLEHWYADGQVLRSSRWPRSHMSDVLRYLTLWKYGGIYLDLDVVVTSSLENSTDFTGAEDWEEVAAGVMGFGVTELGRRMASSCLRDLKKNFRGDVWGNNGPGVIKRTLQKLCSTEYARDMHRGRCHGFRVYPPSAFYPIHYKTWQKYFDEDDTEATMRLLEKSLAIHVWNKLSKYEPVRVNGNSPYAIIARKYCPRVFESCGEVF